MLELKISKFILFNKIPWIENEIIFQNNKVY